MLRLFTFAHPIRLLIAIFALTVTTVAAAACGSEPAPTTVPHTVAPTATQIPAATATQAPTATATLEPTATPLPTATPVPTATALPTNTPIPTDTPVPPATATPIPTATPYPTATPPPIPPTATPPPTAAPTPTPRPTATPIPTPTPIPPPQLNLIKVGFGQFDENVSFAFIVENPNGDIIIRGVEYRVLYLDANGILLQSEAGTLPFILPGDRTAAASTITSWELVSVPEGSVVDRVEIRLQSGTSELLDVDLLREQNRPTKYLGLVENVTYNVTPPGDFDRYETDISVSGTLKNPYQADFTNAELVVVFYGADGNIVGGDTKTPFEFIPAGSKVAFEMTWGWLDDFQEHFATVPVSAEVFLKGFRGGTQ